MHTYKPNGGKRLRVGVDVDGVLADLLELLVQHVEDVFDEKIDPLEVKDHDFIDIFLRKYVDPSRTKDFWETLSVPGKVHNNLKVIPGSIEGIRELQQVADVYIVTAPLFSGTTWTHERSAWLFKHFGIKHKNIIYTHAKYTFFGDALVDDKPANTTSRSNTTSAPKPLTMPKLTLCSTNSPRPTPKSAPSLSA